MIIGNRVVNPGELRTPVLLAPRKITTGTGGFQVAGPDPDPDNQVSAWAKWSNIHGAEVWSAQAAGVTEAATVLIRYHATLNATWYISKDGGSTWFEVISLDNIAERGEYLEIKVKKVEAG